MKLKRYCFPVFLVIVLSAGFGCQKADDSATAAGNTSLLNVINAVTDTKAIDFYQNGTRQNVNSAIYFSSASGYVRVLTGQQQYQFKSDSPRVTISSTTLTPAKKDSTYTAVVTGQISNNTLSTIFISDYFQSADVTKASLRFIQASPGATSYDVAVGDTVSFKSQAFKVATGFVNVGPGKKTVKVMLAGSATPIFTGTVILQSASYYTLFTTGTLAGTGNNALGIGIILSR